MYQAQASVEAIERMVDVQENQEKCMEGLVNQQYKSGLTLPCLSLKLQFLGEILLNIQTLWKHLDVWYSLGQKVVVQDCIILYSIQKERFKSWCTVV